MEVRFHNLQCGTTHVPFHPGLDGLGFQKRFAKSASILSHSQSDHPGIPACLAVMNLGPLSLLLLVISAPQGCVCVCRVVCMQETFRGPPARQSPGQLNNGRALGCGAYVMYDRS